MKENGWWLSTLSSHFYQGDRLLTLEEYKNAVNAIKGNDIKVIANKYLNTTSFVQVALTPAPKAEVK